MECAFKFYDPSRKSRQSLNRVPHWEQPGRTYFCTFRLADAVPAKALADFVREKREWLATQPERPWPEEVEREYHWRFSIRFERWLDRGHGSCLLRDPENAGIVAETLRHFDGERSLIHAWVVMPNHVHVLFSPLGDHAIASLMHSWKGFSARQINTRMNRSGALWQKSYFDRMIRDWDHFANCARYIRNNPKKAKLRAGDFLGGESDFVARMLGEAGVAPGVAPYGCHES
jgi:REP element-mobilizing transposase RayT